MMKKEFQIKEPCQQLWDDMDKVQNGKHCDLCEKKVWDLDDLSNSEINSLFINNASICGKKSLVRPTLSSVFFILTLASASYSNAQTTKENILENNYQKNITINGKLVSEQKRKLLSGEISLVTLEKIYSAKADENGYFSLTFPEKVLSEYNIIRIDYTVLEFNNKEFTDYKSSIIKTNALLGKEHFEIEEKYYTIGGVAINSIQPPNFYYFDGKKIGKRKFEKLRKEFLDYKYLVFYDEVTVQKLTNRSFVDNLYLLYSK